MGEWEIGRGGRTHSSGEAVSSQKDRELRTVRDALKVHLDMGGGSGRSGFIERGGDCEVTDRKRKEREREETHEPRCRNHHLGESWH